MNLIKRIFAVLGLISAAAFAVITVWLLANGQIGQRLDLLLIPLSAFLGFGLLSIGIRWLQNLRKEQQEELAREIEARKKQAQDK